MRSPHDSAPPRAASAAAQLTALYLNARVPVRPLPRSITVLGSAPGCDVVLASPEVAAAHAAIIRGNDGWRVAAIAGLVQVNGADADWSGLQTQDEIGIARFRFRFGATGLAAPGIAAFGVAAIGVAAPGAAATDARMCLADVRSGRRIESRRPLILFGATERCDVHIAGGGQGNDAGPQVVALLAWTDEGPILRRLDAAADVQCNGRPIDERRVSIGDVLRVGDGQFTFSVAASAAAAASASAAARRVVARLPAAAMAIPQPACEGAAGAASPALPPRLAATADRADGRSGDAALQPSGGPPQTPSAVRFAESADRVQPLLAARLPHDQRPRLSGGYPTADESLEPGLVEFDAQLARDLDRLERAQEQVAWATARGAAALAARAGPAAARVAAPEPRAFGEDARAFRENPRAFREDPLGADAPSPEPAVVGPEFAADLTGEGLTAGGLTAAGLTAIGPTAASPTVAGTTAAEPADADAPTPAPLRRPDRRRAADDLRARRAEMSAQRADLQARELALQSRITALEEREREWQSAAETLSAREQTLRQHDESLRTAGDELDAGRRGLERSRQYATEEDARLAERARLLIEKQAELDRMRGDIDAESARLAAEIAAARQRLAELEHETGELAGARRRLQRRRQRTRLARQARRTARRRELDEFRAAMEREGQRFRAALQAEWTARRSELEAELAALDQREQALAERQRQAEIDRAEAAASGDEAVVHAELQAREAEFARRVEAARTELETRWAELQRERADLETARREREEAEAALQAQREQLEAQREHLEAQREHLEAQRDDVEAQAASVQNAEQATTAAAADVQRQTVLAEQRAAEAEHRARQIEERATAAEQAAARAQQQAEAMEGQIAEAHVRFAQAEASTAEALRLRDQAEQARADSDRQIAELEAVGAVRRAELQRIEDKLTARRMELTDAARRTELAQAAIAYEGPAAQSAAESNRAATPAADDLSPRADADEEPAALADTIRMLETQEAGLRERIQSYEAEVGALLRQRDQAAADTGDDAAPASAMTPPAWSDLDQRRDELDAAERRIDERNRWVLGEQERLAGAAADLEARERAWSEQYQRQLSELELRRNDLERDARELSEQAAALADRPPPTSDAPREPLPDRSQAPSATSASVRLVTGVRRPAVALAAVLTLAAAAAGYYLPASSTAVVCDVIVQPGSDDSPAALRVHQAGLLRPEVLRDSAAAAGLSPDFFEQLWAAGQLTSQAAPRAGRVQLRLELPVEREADGLTWLGRLATVYAGQWSQSARPQPDPRVTVLASQRDRIAGELAAARRTLAEAERARAADPAAPRLRELRGRLTQLQGEYRQARSAAEDAAREWAAIQGDSSAASKETPAADTRATLEGDAVYQADLQEARARAEFVASELSAADDLLRPLLKSTPDTCRTCLADVQAAAQKAAAAPNATSDDEIKSAAARIAAAVAAYQSAVNQFGESWRSAMSRVLAAAGDAATVLSAQVDAGERAEHFAVAARKQVADLREAVQGLTNGATGDAFARRSALQSEWSTAVRSLLERHRDLMFAAAGASTSANHRLDAAARTAAALLERLTQREVEIRDALSQSARRQQDAERSARLATARQKLTEAADRRQKLADELADLQGRLSEPATAAASLPSPAVESSQAEVARLDDALKETERQLAALRTTAVRAAPAARLTVTQPRRDESLESQRIARAATFGGLAGVPAMGLLLLLAAFGRRGLEQAA